MTSGIQFNPQTQQVKNNGKTSTATQTQGAGQDATYNFGNTKLDGGASSASIESMVSLGKQRISTGEAEIKSYDSSIQSSIKDVKSEQDVQKKESDNIQSKQDDIAAKQARQQEISQWFGENKPKMDNLSEQLRTTYSEENQNKLQEQIEKKQTELEQKQTQLKANPNDPALQSVDQTALPRNAEFRGKIRADARDFLQLLHGKDSF